MNIRRAVFGASLTIVVCVSCSGAGPYSLGEDRPGEVSDHDASSADVSPGDATSGQDVSVDSGGIPTSILCGESAEPCAADEFCDFSDTACGTTSVAGRCLPRPAVSDCPVECNPVCGCDDVTYCNECFAHVAGFDRKLPCP